MDEDIPGLEELEWDEECNQMPHRIGFLSIDDFTYEDWMQFDYDKIMQTIPSYDEYCDFYYNIFQDIPLEEKEREWDEERIRQPHYYEEDEQIPTIEELIEDEIRMNLMDFDDWSDFMYKIKKKIIQF